METTRYYLQEKMQPCIKELFSHYMPEQQFKSIHDLFNVQKFHQLLTCILGESTKNKLADLKLVEDSGDQSYNEMRKKNFRKVFDIISQSYDILGITLRQRISDQEISKMIEQSDIRLLHMYMEHIFELLKHNNEILEYITTLDDDIQNSIMEVMENSQLTVFGDENFPGSSDLSLNLASKIIRSDIEGNNMAHLQEVENHMHQMEVHIQLKEEEIKELKFSKQQVDEELEYTKRQLSSKHEEIDQLKKRIMSYDEIDQLMVQKDEQILKLSKKLADHELKYRLKQTQLTNQNKQLQERLSQLETKDLQIAVKYEKQKQLMELLTKQKEESQTSMKKVINNLKDKNKSFMEKINDLQKELIEANFEKQMKEKELIQLKNCSPEQRKPFSCVFDNLHSPRSPLREDINEQIGSVGGNYSKLGQQLSIDLDRADFEDDFGPVPRQQNNKRFNQLLQENYLLKQQVQKIQLSGFVDSKQSKQLHDEVQKMKKKINILKRRNEEIENQRKEEIEIMIGIMQQCCISTCSQGNKK